MVAFTACDTEVAISRDHIVFFSDKVTTETTENSATITTYKPYIMSGLQEESVVIYMEYWVEGYTTKQKVETYTERLGDVVFSINGLTPATTYSARLAMGCAEHNKISYGAEFSFTTKEHIPVAGYSCECVVDAKGVWAGVTLKDVAFTIDGVESPLAKVEFKYAQSLAGGNWTTVEVSKEQLAEGFIIPAEGEEYLTPESNYKYTVTLYPEDQNFEEYTLNGKFSTTATELLAKNVSTPEITADNESITLTSTMPKLFIDGIEIPGYFEVKYQFIYTDNNGDQGIMDAICAEDMMSATAPLSLFKEGVTYDFRSRMEVDNKHVMDSDAVQYTMPVKETPVPTPPTPPISGDADTTDIAGDWHLTMWRGSVPSFDVYLSITDDGVVSLFQRIDSRLWETFYSTVEMDNGIISGVYTDEVAWAHSYFVAIDGDTMTWTSTSDSTEVSVYTRSTLPDFTNPDIRTNATKGTRWF